jgi:hypothetical protein
MFMKFVIKYFHPKSLIFSAVPIVLFFLGVVSGILTFFVLPTGVNAGLSFTQKLIATGLASLLYMISLMAILLVAVFLYNFFVHGLGLGGLAMDIEPEEDAQTPQQ